MGSIPELNFDGAILKQDDELFTGSSVLKDEAEAENNSIKSR